MPNRGETQEIRKLKVDLIQLGSAFGDSSWERSYYLDLETGKVVMIADEIRWELERIYEEEYDPEAEEPIDLADALQRRDLPEWRREALLEAERVEAEYNTRYISVSQPRSNEDYRDMERFIATVEDDRLRDRLWRAISGRGAFRYFRDVLYDHPRERERWFEFKDAQVQRRITRWLESEGIEPIFESPPAPEPSRPSPPPRARLIDEVLTFVRSVARAHHGGPLPGVTRIALIGSLTTDEPDPEDAELLVTVTDDADLAPLARLARKLQGHAQSFRRGGEVFLADPDGNYLGRTCPWKKCGPGIHAACDALHCGRRPYLHDDLEAVQLDKSLIAAPPIELWPQVEARVSPPEDIEQGLIAPLG